jgi:hypothetical protein
MPLQRTRDPPAAPAVAATPKNVKKPKTEELFCQYAGVEDIEAEEIGPNGVMKFISDLQIKAEDVKRRASFVRSHCLLPCMTFSCCFASLSTVANAPKIISLVLAWHFDAKRAGYFSKAEFISGMEKLKCTGICAAFFFFAVSSARCVDTCCTILQALSAVVAAL